MNPLTTRRGWQATGFRSSRLAGSDPSHTSIQATVIPGDESRRSRRDLIVSATDRSRLERGVAPAPHASPRWPVFVSGSMPGPDFRLRGAVRHAGVRSPLPHRLPRTEGSRGRRGARGRTWRRAATCRQRPRWAQERQSSDAHDAGCGASVRRIRDNPPSVDSRTAPLPEACR
jgi:hypothetical protein